MKVIGKDEKILAGRLTIKNTQLLPKILGLDFFSLNNQWLIELEEAGFSSSGNLQRKQRELKSPFCYKDWTGSFLFQKYRTNLDRWRGRRGGSVLVGPVGMDTFLTSFGLMLMCVQCSTQGLNPTGKNVCLSIRYWPRIQL